MPTRSAALFGLVLLLAGCGSQAPLDPRPVLGDFRMGYDIVQARDVTKGPLSREASEAELTAALGDAIDARLGRYDGDGLYHLAVAIGAYVLAQPGLPIVYTPRSVLIFEVTLFDNSTGRKLNPEPHRITAFEGIGNIAPVIGSGLARGREAQLANLSAEGARVLEAWLNDHPEWFAGAPGATRIEFDRDRLRAAGAAAVAASRAPR